MSEVFGDDFPDVFSTVLNDAETAARRQVESATGQLVAILRNRTVAEHERAVRAEREVARLDAHLRTCEAARTNAEVRLAELDTGGHQAGRRCPVPAGGRYRGRDAVRRRARRQRHMEELWPEVERLRRETDLTLPEAAQQVASVAVWGGLR